MAITGRSQPQSTGNRSNQSWSFSQRNLSLPYTETWTGADSSSWPGFWTTATDGLGSAINIQSNTGRITLGTTGSYGASAVGALNTYVTGQDVTGSFTTSDDTEFIVRIMVGGLSLSGAFPADSYALFIVPSNNEIQLERFTGGSNTGITAVSSMAIVGGTDTVNFRIRKVGKVIAARVWLNAASEPTTWNLATVDGTHVNGTYIGLAVQGGNVGAAKSVSFDNVVISETSEVPAVPDPTDNAVKQRWSLVTWASGALPHAPTNGTDRAGSRLWLLGHQPYYPSLNAVVPDAGLVSATGSAHNASISLKPQAGLATATTTPLTDPTDIANCSLWIDPTQDSYSDGDQVATAVDRSATALNLTQGTAGARPIFKSAAFGPGRPGYLFDGTDDYLAGSATSNYLTTTAGTMFAVFKVVSVSTDNLPSYGNEAIWCEGGGGGDAALDLRSSVVRAALPAELRPGNYAKNHKIPVDGVDYDSAQGWPAWSMDNSTNRVLVDGNFSGTTDEIFQWAATKWSIDVDLIRAAAAQESWWDADTNGDDGASFGLMQVKPSAAGMPGTDAAKFSSAYNVDLWCAWFTDVYTGKFKLWRDNYPGSLGITRAYAAGDLEGTLESWYTGVGPRADTTWYSTNALAYRTSKPWLNDQDFIRDKGINPTQLTAMAANWDGSDDYVEAAIPLNDTVVVMWKHGSNVLSISVNGATPVTVASGTTSSLAGALYVGRQYDSINEFANFYLGEMAGYTRELTQAEVDQVFSYLLGRWATTTASVEPDAELVSATATAYDATITASGSAVEAPAGLVSATGTAYDTPNLLKPQAGLVSATGTAYTVGINIKVSTELASAAATAYNATVTAFGVGVADAGLASATGTAYNPTVSVKPNAELVSASGTAYTVGSITIALSGGLASASGAAYDTPNLVAPNAGLASGTGTAYDATITAVPFVNVNAGLVSATGTAYDALAAVAPNAGLVSASGTAYGASISFGVQAGLVSGTGTAYNPAVTAFGVGVANAEAATATGTAYDPTIATKPNAELASATGTAYTVGSITIAVAAGLVSGTGTAYNPPNLVAPSAGLVTASGTAYDTTIDAYPVVSAPAGVAEAVGTAYNPTITTSSGDILVEPGAALATGTAYDPTIAVVAQAGAVTATGTAYNASISIETQAEPALATGTAHSAIDFSQATPTAALVAATAYDVVISITVESVGVASATATAYDATIGSYPVTPAYAELVTASGVTYDATVVVAPTPAVAAATGTAHDATAEAHPYVSIDAGLAEAVGTSYLATAAVDPQPGVALVTGDAYSATIAFQVSPGIATAAATAYAPALDETTGSDYAAATATAQAPALGLGVNAGLVTATATAHDATIEAAPYVQALAGVATATATAYDVAEIVETFDLTPATITFAAQTLTVLVEGAASLIAATATITAQTLTVTPSLATTNLTAATGSFAAQTLTVTPGTGSANLAPATLTATPATLTPTNDISNLVDHHAAALGFQSIGQRTLVIPSGALDDKDRPWALRGYDRGLVAAPVPPVTVSVAAQDLTVTTGAVTTDLGAATITMEAIQFGLNGQETDLPPAAVVTLQGQTLVPVGGAISVDLDTAVTVTISARDLSATNNPRLSPASIDFEAQTMVPEILRGSISQFFPGPIKVFQGTLTTRTDLLYEVPEGFFLMIKEVTLQKIGVGSTATRLWSVPLSQNTSTANAFMYDVTVTDYIDQKMDMVLSAGERLYARCAADGQVVCRVDGYLLSNKSLPTPRVFFRGLVSDTYAEVAVTDLSAVGMVKFVSIANTTASERTIDISTTISGIAPTDSGAIRRSLAVPGNSSVFIPLTMVLSVSEALAVKADVGGALSLNISGATAPRSVAVLSRTEIRPHNYTVNHTIPVDGVDYDSTTQWPDWAFDDSSYRALVTGNFEGTTDEIFRWAATKWDINVDLIRAVAVQESAWDARTNGDGGLSFGLMQVKPSALGNVGTNAATVSSAWNVDYWCARFKTVYDGKGKLWRDRPDLTNRVYTAGDLWGSVESWFTGIGPSDATAWYSANIRHYIEQRPWETDPDFINQVGNWAWV